MNGKIMELVRESGAQAVLLTDPMNMRYFSGFKGGEGAVYLSEKQRVLITDSRYTEAASRESDFEIREEKQHFCITLPEGCWKFPTRSRETPISTPVRSCTEQIRK